MDEAAVEKQMSYSSFGSAASEFISENEEIKIPETVHNGDGRNTFVAMETIKSLGLRAYSINDKRTVTAMPLSSVERTLYLSMARGKAIEMLSMSKSFATENLKQKYVDRLKTAKLIDKGGLKINNPAYANFRTSTITLYYDFFLREYTTVNGIPRYEPSSRMVTRMAEILLHELRHLAPVNDRMSTPESSARASITAEDHNSDPAEIDADEFSERAGGRRPPGERITDFD
jgi:hypothetical protein